MSTYLRVRKYGRRVLFGLIVLTALLSALWYRRVTGEKGEVEGPPPAETVASGAEMITRDFRHVETRMNRTLWILEAAVAEVFESRARLQRVKITWYGEGEAPIVVTGRAAQVDLANWNAVISGDVKAVAGDGSILKTRQLQWDNETRLLTAPWPVRISSRHFDVEGRRMTANADEKWVRLDGRVHAVVRPPAALFEPAT